MCTYLFGIFDMILGIFVQITAKRYLNIVDDMNAKTHPERIVGAEINKIFSLRKFSERVTVKTEGTRYKSLNHYYHECSVTHRMQDIKKPTFFISSLDDPIMGPHVIPYEKCYENILLGVTKAGGHLTFFEGLFLPSGQWFTKPTFEFLNYFVKKQVEEEAAGKSCNL